MNKSLHTSLKSKKKVLDVIFEWTSLERQWKPRDRAWYVTYGTFFTVLIAAFAILQEYIVIVAIIAFVFLWFTQAAIPPSKTTHKITGLGIKTYGKLYRWSDINHFWFSLKGDFLLLNLDVLKGDLVSEGKVQRLSLILEPEEQDEIFFTLVKFVDYGDTQEVNYNILERILYGKHIPVTTFMPENVEEKDLFEESEEEDLSQK